MFAKRAASWRCARHLRIIEVEPESPGTQVAIGALLEAEAGAVGPPGTGGPWRR
jgi:hypothetical protein